MSSDIGMDVARHDRPPHDTSSIVRRAPLRWPDGARVAFAVVISAEYYEMQPAAENFIPANVPGGFGRAPYPDVRAFSQRDYGNRVGIFRVIEALQRSAMPATAAVDAGVAARYPYIVDELQRHGIEIAGHGHAVTNVISSHMTEAAERGYIASALETLMRVSGTRPIGWHGPEYGQSERTPALLAELGLDYTLDWPNDEQPFLMRTEPKPLLSLAMALELDDVVTMWHRRVSAERWRVAVGEALDQLLADSGNGGRHLILNVHPWLIGHPHRIGYLEEVLADVRRRAGVWIASVAQIAKHARGQLDG
jgi:peptidoglycan/xylan/chitin deacetylase (PgdA/CDA1 family)